MRIPVFPHDGDEAHREWWRGFFVEQLHHVLLRVHLEEDVPEAEIQAVLSDLADWWTPSQPSRGPSLVGGAIPLITHAIFQEDVE